MLSKEEWNANKDAASIIYCFEDGHDQGKSHNGRISARSSEHSAEDFGLSKAFRMGTTTNTAVTIRTEIIALNLHKANSRFQLGLKLSGFHLRDQGPLEALLRRNKAAFCFSCLATPATGKRSWLL